MPAPANWRERVKGSLDEYERSPDKIGRPYDELFDSFVWMEPEPATSLNDFRRWLSELDGSWGFRGQRESAWTLQTSLDREIRVFHATGHYPLDRQTEENELLFRFQQQAHNYLRHLPAADDRATWLALMQHHGVPTRLLDWTQSPYVALYFAVEETPQGTEKNCPSRSDEKKARQEEPCSAVWAINLKWLEEKATQELGSISDDPRTRIQYLNGVLGEKKRPLIVRIDPLQGNERMFTQQGFFLWKLYAETPYFDQILISMMLNPELPGRPVIRKLRIGETHRIEFLKSLREMNIHRASLFPGIDGFCQSLRVDLQIKVDRERQLANLRNAKGARD